MVPRVSKPEAGGFTLKGRVSSQHGRSCQHLPLPSGMVPESLPFYALRERRWLQAGWMFKVTTVDISIQTTANRLPHCPSPPAGLEATIDMQNLGQLIRTRVLDQSTQVT